MRGRRDLHDGAKQCGLAIERRVGAGQNIHGHRDEHVEQAELRHGPRDGREEDADGGREEEVEAYAQHEQRHRAVDRNVQEPLHHEFKRKARRHGDDEAVRPNLRQRDLERRERHHQQVIHRPVLALAHHGGAGQNDREHGDVVDDAHHAGKPAGRHVRVERHADGEVHGRLRRRASDREMKRLISSSMICEA